MPISAAKKQWRKSAAGREARNAWLRAYRQRPDVKAREAKRAKGRRETPGGAEINRARVKANRAKLGRNYLTELIRDQTGVACRDIPGRLVDLKREQLLLTRLAVTMKQAAFNQQEES